MTSVCCRFNSKFFGGLFDCVTAVVLVEWRPGLGFGKAKDLFLRMGMTQHGITGFQGRAAR